MGQANPTLTYTFTGFVNGENATTAGLTGSANLATTATTSSPAGNYPISVTGAGTLAAANYRFPSAAFGTATLTVTAGTVSVGVVSSLPGSTYGQSVSFTVAVSGGGPTPTGTVQFLVDGINFGSAVTLVDGTAISPSTTLLGAGNHTVKASYSGDPNYAANSGTYTEVVNQAPLSIIPDNGSRAVGQANPTLTYTFTGFVNGENATTAGLTGSANLATTATTSSPAGNYPISVTGAGTLAAANYRFPSAAFGTATLTVTPFAASAVVGSTLPGSTYGQSVSFTVSVSSGGPTPTGTVQFLVNGTAFGYGRAPIGRERDESQYHAPGRGQPHVEADYSGDSNYFANSDSLIQAVSKAHLTATADAQTKVYGAVNPVLTATLTGFVNGDTAAAVSGASQPEHHGRRRQRGRIVPDHCCGRLPERRQLRLPQPGQRHADDHARPVDRRRGVRAGAGGGRPVPVRPTGSPWAFSGASGIAANSSGFTAGNPPAPRAPGRLPPGHRLVQPDRRRLGRRLLRADLLRRPAGQHQASRQDFKVLVDGVVVGTFTPSGTSYQSYTTAAFTVTAGSHTIAFQGLDTAGGDNTAFVDQVVVASASQPADRRRGVRAGAGGGRPVPVRPDRLALDVLRQCRHLGQRQRLHRRQPAGPAGHPGRLPPGDRLVQPDRRRLGRRLLRDQLRRRPARQHQASRQDFQVLVDGVVVGTFTPSGTSYQSYTTAAFTVTAGSHTITFQGLDTAGGDNTAFIEPSVGHLVERCPKFRVPALAGTP